MAICYLDSSALVKVLLNEDGSDIARGLWLGSAITMSAGIAYPEVRAALAMASRRGRLSGSESAAAKLRWESMWKALSIIDTSQPIVELAGDLAEEHRLRGFDAVHLASLLSASVAHTIVATWDRDLAGAAAAIGYSIAPG
ncbi:MAG: type II toxin-antitoxin system VapC family toxin [Actinomycetota bacterium]